MINTNALRVALVERRLAQWQVARRLGFEPSTFSDYIRGARRAPNNLGQRIERSLRLPAGTLTKEA